MGSARYQPAGDDPRVGAGRAGAPHEYDYGAPDGPDSTALWVLRLARGIVFFIYAVVVACLALLTTGFILRLFGASTDASFTEWVYRNVDRVMEPFRGMFPTPAVTDRSVVDFSLLFAMVVYAVGAIGLHALVSWLADRVVAVSRPRPSTRWAAGPPPSRSPGRPGLSPTPPPGPP